MSNETRVTKVTNEGLQKLKDELNYLKDVKRNEVVEAIRLALSYGDLSENSEYDEAKNEQAKVESRIQELEELLKNVVVISDHEITTDTVGIGATVVVKRKNQGEADYGAATKTYTIVGATEADALKGRISDRSPIGSGLLNRKKGEEVEIELPSGATAVFLILEINK